MKYYHVDVFADKPMSGNGLTVVFPESNMSTDLMLSITREFRQFETIFVLPKKSGSYPVRIFTVEEELDFAGHPVVGACAVIHRYYENVSGSVKISFSLGGRTVSALSSFSGDSCHVIMNQGNARFLGSFDKIFCRSIIEQCGLEMNDICDNYPIETVSTGLEYLFLPVNGCLDKIRIRGKDLESKLLSAGAKFVYFFDPETKECRTWDNCGITEDVATGSAAGPLFAYFVKNGYKKNDERITLNQGRFAGRPSRICGWVDGFSSDVFVEGDVAFFGTGELIF